MPRLLQTVVAAVQTEGLQCLTIRDALTAIGYQTAQARFVFNVSRSAIW